jgi:serine/threonine protein phosphatase PrpC
MHIGYISDLGKTRKINEDSILCLQINIKDNESSDFAGFFVLADGMGGHNAGEIASSTAIRILNKAFINWLNNNTDIVYATAYSFKTINDFLINAIGNANTEIYKKAKENQKLNGMGTTITAAFIFNGNFYVASVGDSRCYIVNADGIEQINKDHSIVQEMVDAGAISYTEARVHPQKNILTRVIGYNEMVDIDIFHRNIYRGDNLLLCSDGLWGFIPDSLIKDIILGSDYPAIAVEKLVEEANNAGGLDNISVIVIRPDNLPERDAILQAETQIVKSGFQSDSKDSEKKWFSFFQRAK